MAEANAALRSLDEAAPSGRREPAAEPRKVAPGASLTHKENPTPPRRRTELEAPAAVRAAADRAGRRRL